MRSLLFFLGLVAIIGLSFFIYKKTNRKNSTRFTPQELAVLVRDHDANEIIGKCINKKFEGQNGIYSYYKNSSTSNDAILMEQIEISDTSRFLTYMIKNEKSYSRFISYIRNHNEKTIEDENKIPSLKKTYPYYLLNGCVFIDRNFEDDGYHQLYRINIMPRDKLALLVNQELAAMKQKREEEISDSLSQKQIADSIAALRVPKVSFPATAYVLVNETTVYEQPNTSFGEVCNITKDIKLRLYKEENGFYRCDFEDDSGTPKTGWILKDDITLKKPKPRIARTVI